MKAASGYVLYCYYLLCHQHCRQLMLSQDKTFVQNCEFFSNKFYMLFPSSYMAKFLPGGIFQEGFFWVQVTL